MSQSPSDITDSDAVFRYRQAWSAINTLLEQGRSLSGRERNCAFLNTGGERFADISAVSGLDLIDDGRGVAITDWDHDGRLDLWTTNRTSPWIRFLHNDSRTGNHFLSLRLQGRSCNRDAIGARVVVALGGEKPRTLYKTLRAGEGFVAQSSKWLHFGLGDSETIRSLVVHWPGGKAETFVGMEANGHFTLIQGAGRAKTWSPPRSASKLAAAEVSPAAPIGQARIFMVSRLPLPKLTYLDLDGQPVSLSHAPDAGPRLINLWAAWCRPCAVEMSEWTKHEQRLRTAGLDILALSVDDLGDEVHSKGPDNKGRRSNRQAARKQIKSLGFPFGWAMATTETVETLEIVARSLVDKHTPLPVPASMLIDAQGRVAAIYRGPVDVEQLLADVAKLDAPAAVVRNHAAHFPGRWFHKQPPAANPSPIVNSYLLAGRTQQAERYLNRYVAMLDVSSLDGAAKQSLAEAYYLVAKHLRSSKKLNEAVAAYRKALTLHPTQPRVNLDLGTVLLTLKKLSEAVVPLKTALHANPKDGATRKLLVIALCLGKNAAQALPHARVLVKEDANDAFARLFLAKALRASGKTNEAVQQYRAAFVLALPKTARFQQAVGRVRQLVQTDPSDPFARLFFAKALQTHNHAPEAIVEYRRALKLRPGWVTAQNDLAWLLATHPDAKVRDGAEALRLAESACKTTADKVPPILDTLAAAQAETGDFAAAVATVDKAIALAGDQKAAALVKQLESRRRDYAAKRPFRETP